MQWGERKYMRCIVMAHFKTVWLANFFNSHNYTRKKTIDQKEKEKLSRRYTSISQTRWKLYKYNTVRPLIIFAARRPWSSKKALPEKDLKRSILRLITFGSIVHHFGVVHYTVCCGLIKKTSFSFVKMKASEYQIDPTVVVYCCREIIQCKFITYVTCIQTTDRY